jgi:DNA-binding CsgD family transcriptional regulator
VTVASPDRLRRDLVDLVHSAGDVREFSIGAARILGRCVGFDGVCMITLDPATSLPTAEVAHNGLPPSVQPRMAQIEIGGDDVNTFQALLRSTSHAATLSQATDGELERSRRHRELRAPNGFGDELRTVLPSEGVAWGGLTLLRRDDRGRFTPADAALVGSLSRHLAEGVRRAVLLAALSGRPREDEGEAGLLLLADDDSIVTTDASADAWLAQLRATEPNVRLPAIVAAVASQARRATDAGEPLLARARVRTSSGAWLVIRASTLRGDGGRRTAVTLEPARAHDLAPLIADAYQLTEKERAVTQLVAYGLSTAAIGARLHISPWTVQDHLKSIFEKVGVSTRGELVARLFFEHYAPRLSERAPLGRNGWFDSR